MTDHAWVDEFPGSIIVCDPQGIVLEMNKKAELQYAEDGGRELIGRNALNCHPERARAIMAEMLENQRTNIYTIEKRGQKKLIYQTPWYQDGVYAGFMEISLVIPVEMPHFVRG